MCTGGEEPGPGWEPVPLRRDWAARESEDGMRVRILCGSYEPSSPFIDGGCATDWIEDLAEPDSRLQCPRCGQWCSEEIVGCARGMLATRTVFVVGCSHRSFTFSRRRAAPYFNVDETPGRRREG